MMSNPAEIEPFTLGDFIFESKIRHDSISDSGLRVYGVDRTNGLTPDAKYVSKNLDRYKVLRPGMFAYNPMRLNIGSIAHCTDQHAVGLVSPDYVVFGCRPGVLDPEYLSYVIKGPEWRQWTTAAGVGSVRVRIYFRELAKMPIVVPSFDEQKVIASMLRTLDEKIKMNGQMNVTLEAIARAVFENWLHSHENKIVEHRIQELIDAKILQIGDGYRAKNSEFSADGLPFIRAGNLKDDGLDLAGAEVLSASSVVAAGHKVGMTGDVAFTSKGTIGRITRVPAKIGSFVYSPQVCFWRTIVPGEVHPNVLYRWMKSESFTGQVAMLSTQTDMAPYISLQDQKKMTIQLPPGERQEEIAAMLEVIDDKIAANAEESRTLANLRDTLLPQLLNRTILVSSLI